MATSKSTAARRAASQTPSEAPFPASPGDKIICAKHVSAGETEAAHTADIYTALVALSQVSALLEVAIGSDLRSIHREIVQQALWGIHSEVDRARVALNGEDELKPREQDS